MSRQFREDDNPTLIPWRALHSLNQGNRSALAEYANLLRAGGRMDINAGKYITPFLELLSRNISYMNQIKDEGGRTIPYPVPRVLINKDSVTLGGVRYPRMSPYHELITELVYLILADLKLIGQSSAGEDWQRFLKNIQRALQDEQIIFAYSQLDHRDGTSNPVASVDFLWDDLSGKPVSTIIMDEPDIVQGFFSKSALMHELVHCLQNLRSYTHLSEGFTKLGRMIAPSELIEVLDITRLLDSEHTKKLLSFLGKELAQGIDYPTAWGRFFHEHGYSNLPHFLAVGDIQKDSQQDSYEGEAYAFELVYNFMLEKSSGNPFWGFLKLRLVDDEEHRERGASFWDAFLLSWQDTVCNPTLPGILKHINLNTITLYYQFIRGKLAGCEEKIQKAYQSFDLDRDKFNKLKQIERRLNV